MMPRAMTPDEAAVVRCPFVTTADSEVSCAAAGCACWGWVDGEEGELASEWEHAEIESTEIVNTAAEMPRPLGDRWIPDGYRNVFDFGNKVIGRVYKWRRHPIKGPRRGQCEAMSPYIEVVGS